MNARTRNCTIVVLALVISSVVALAPDPALAADSCKCSGTISAGDLLGKGNFDNYCPQFSSYCPKCGDPSGTAKCTVELQIGKQECDAINADPTNILPHLGVPSAVSILLSATGSCNFTAGTAPAATAPEKGGGATKSSGGDTAGGLVPAECRGAADVGSCGLQSLVNVFVLFANYIFGIAGSLAFVFFIYGGYVWLSSAGSAEKIKQGQTIVVNAVIGLVLVFGARGIVGLVVTAITKGANVPIDGGSCKPPTPLPASSPISPRYMTDKEGKLVCVASCDDLKTLSGKKYECMKPSDGTECVTKLCEGGADNVCCAKPAPGSGGGAGSSADPGGMKSCGCITNDNKIINISITASLKCSDVSGCAFNDSSNTCTCGGVAFPGPDDQASRAEFVAMCNNISSCSGK